MTVLDHNPVMKTCPTCRDLLLPSGACAACGWQPRKPTDETGVYLFVHQHDWLEVGAEQYPSGSWHPVFRCQVCTNVIVDLNVEVR